MLFVAIVVGTSALPAGATTEASESAVAADGHQQSVDSGAPDTDLTSALETPQAGPPSGGKKGVVYFGIDDGPSCSDTVTWGMLDLFARHGARATWFVTGSVNCDPAALRAIVRAGHAVGSHTYGHDNLVRLSHAGRLATFDRLQAAVTRHGGPTMTCYRPPYGNTNGSVRASAAQRGMVEWLWNVDPRDWSDPGVSRIVATFNRLKDGDVVVIHDGNSNQQTLDALRIWLPANVDRFDFAPLPGCAAAEPPLCHGMRATIVGTDGTDTLHGTDGNDVIWAGAGNDTVRAGGGNDVICAGPGDDVVYGGAGDDVILGGDGHDHLYGGSGKDDIRGNAGDDTLRGGGEADSLRGGPGGDKLWGNAGDDMLAGMEDADDLYGGRGNDLLRGGAGNDTVRGGPGSDQLWGNRGKDTLLGGPGRDTLRGGAGNDVLRGGPGTDTLRGGPGKDACAGGPGKDTAKMCESVTSIP